MKLQGTILVPSKIVVTDYDFLSNFIDASLYTLINYAMNKEHNLTFGNYSLMPLEIRVVKYAKNI